MPYFDYAGRFAAGGALAGTIEAQSPDEATAILERLGVQIHSVRPSRGPGYVTPLTLDEFTFFNEQLSVLTRAGVPLDEGLKQLAADTGSGRLRRLLTDLADELHDGTPLEVALEKHQRRFPPGYGAVVGAGIRTGDVGGVLYSVVAASRRSSAFRRSLVGALTYPVTVLVLTLAIVSLIMRLVMPQIESAYYDLMGWEAGLPMLHEGAFAVARAWPAVDVGLIIAAVVIAVAALLLALLPAGAGRDYFLRRLPGCRGMYWNGALARFTHVGALAALRAAPLPELLRTAGDTCGSPSLRSSARRIAGELERGAELATVAQREPLLPPIWVTAVQVAGPRGDLPGVLADMARNYEASADRAATLLRVVLGPLIFSFAIVALVSIAVVVLTLVVGLLQSIMG